MRAEELPEPAKYMLLALYVAKRPLDRLRLTAIMIKLAEAFPSLKRALGSRSSRSPQR